MSVNGKNKSKIIVEERLFYWYVVLDDDSIFNILNIISDDKELIISCPLNTEVPYIISKGHIFQNKKTSGIWTRYMLPHEIPESITPKYVESVIKWATKNKDAVEIAWDGNSIPI